MELRVPVQRLEKQAMMLAIIAGEKPWRHLDSKGRNTYRRLVVSLLTGCGIESVVVTDDPIETPAETSEEGGEGEHSSTHAETPEGRSQTPQDA